MKSLRPTHHNLHWVLDVVFHDDFARLRTANEPRNMAVIRHFAINLVRSCEAAKIRSQSSCAERSPAGTPPTSPRSSELLSVNLDSLPCARIAARPSFSTRLERLDHHKNHNHDHQRGGNFVEDSKEPR